MFKKAVIGGSFDHFHKGHKSFLDYSMSIASFLIVGVTSDEYLRENKEGFMENYETRSGSLSKYLAGKKARFEMVKIKDVYGKTLDPSFDAEVIVVTYETKRGADEINRERLKKGLKKLKIRIAKTEFAEDHYDISSERIRVGEIDREGKLYIKPEWFKNELLTNAGVLPDLKRPFGEVLQNLMPEDLKIIRKRIFAVGDESAKQIKSLGISPNVSFIDFKVARKIKFSRISDLGFSNIESIVKLKNPPGRLTPDLFKVAYQLTHGGEKQESIVLIDGEDDLAVLPVTLAAPLGSLVFYGQPDEGIVKVLTDENHKAKAREIVARFTTRGY